MPSNQINLPIIRNVNSELQPKTEEEKEEEKQQHAGKETKYIILYV